MKTQRFQQSILTGRLPALILIITLWLIALINSQTTSVAGPEEALVFYFPFDEGEGVVAKDKSPNGFEANLQGDYKWVRQGKVAGAIEFTQGSAIVPDDDRLNVEQITVMAWLLPTSITAENTGLHWEGNNAIYNKSGESDDSVVLAFMDKDGAFFYINSGPGGNNRMGPFNGADVDNTLSLPDIGIQTNQWYHVAGTFDGESIKIYLGGELAGEKKIPMGNSSIIWNDNNCEIGGRLDNKLWFVGILDEVAMFNRALTKAETKQIMKMRMAVEPGGKLTTTWGEK